MATARVLMTNKQPKSALELARDIFYSLTGQPAPCSWQYA